MKNFKENKVKNLHNVVGGEPYWVMSSVYGNFPPDDIDANDPALLQRDYPKKNAVK